ncbi:MAG: hypothetical protein V4688_02200 [Pseudomonadota bacterium]
MRIEVALSANPAFKRSCANSRAARLTLRCKKLGIIEMQIIRFPIKASALIFSIIVAAVGAGCTVMPEVSHPETSAILHISSNHQGSFANNTWLTYNDEACTDTPQRVAHFSWATGSAKDVVVDSGKPVYLLAVSMGIQSDYYSMASHSILMAGCQSLVAFTPAANTPYAVRHNKGSCRIEVQDQKSGATPSTMRVIPISGNCGLKSR